MIDVPGASGLLSLVFNILWLVLFGWELFLAHLATELVLCVTGVGRGSKTPAPLA